MNQRGFTIIELLALFVLLTIIGAVFWSQKTAIETSARDDSRKTSINAMYYALEEVYYPANKHYPKTLSSSTLPSIDPQLFNDPNDIQLGTAGSDFRYQAKNCSGDSCKSYTLRTKLDSEADYVKDSRNE